MSWSWASSCLGGGRDLKYYCCYVIGTVMLSTLHKIYGVGLWWGLGIEREPGVLLNEILREPNSQEQ